MFVAASDFFRNSNYLEAMLWFAVAAGFVIAAMGRAVRRRGRLLIAAVAFALFGASDIIEVETGAWWRPWWLLVWKAICVAMFLFLYVDYLRMRLRRRRELPTPSPSGRGQGEGSCS